jgi:O-phosphoseryl-tRNA(Cys) synthetase
MYYLKRIVKMHAESLLPYYQFRKSNTDAREDLRTKYVVCTSHTHVFAFHIYSHYI